MAWSFIGNNLDKEGPLNLGALSGGGSYGYAAGRAQAAGRKPTISTNKLLDWAFI